MINQRPQEGDYAPFYANYVNNVAGNDILSTLRKAKGDTLSLINGFSSDFWQYSYAEGKWTIAELMIHILDAERVFSYRAMRIARGDSTPLPGFDQDDYVPNSNAANRSGQSIIEEYLATREATLQLFSNFDETIWHNKGTASDHPVTPLALAYITAGHEIHHMEIIKERYLKS
jgi:hypothetical protein